jgi:hypothetical protein
MPKAISHLWWLPTIMSALLSALGILALALHAFDKWSLSAPLQLVMASYKATMQVLFGWAHPYLQAALTWLGSFIGWRPTLYPHWRDVFVVIGLLSVGAGRAAWRAGEFDTVAFATVVGATLGAAVNALLAGMLPLQSPDLMTQLLIAASAGLPVLTFLVFGLAIEEVVIGLILAAVASTLAAFATLLLSSTMGSAGGLGLAGIASSVVMFGLFFLVFGMSEQPGSNARVIGVVWGLTILGGFVGAAFLAAVDAGLKLLGA